VTELQERMKVDFVTFAREVVPDNGDWYELSLVMTVKKEGEVVTVPAGVAMRIKATEFRYTEPEPRSLLRRLLGRFQLW